MINKLDMKVSKFISLVLRHKPEEIGVILNSDGFIKVYDLITGINRKMNLSICYEDIERIVVNDDKKRYSFNEDKTMIRANQGHSTKSVSLEFKEVEPPKYLYHGTSTRVIDSILKDGVKKMSRQYVHLSKDIDTASKVGKRHGELVILIVDSEEMHHDGFKFFLSDNNVWLIDYIPPKYLSVLS